MSEIASAKSPFRLFRTVVSAFFGVRGKSGSDNDLANLSIRQIVFTAVIMMALFVTTIVLIVKTVVQ